MKAVKAVAFILVILLTFQVYGDNDSDVSISVKHNCEVQITDFLSPGNGTGLVAQNSTGYFMEVSKNTGTLTSNITVEYLNITKQNDSWSPGEPIGNITDSYNGTNFTNVSMTGERLYDQQFNATVPPYEEGWYTARTNVTTSCSDKWKNVSENTSLKDNDSDYLNFQVVKAFGEEGGVNTSGNQTTNQTFPEDINSTGNESTNETVPEEFNQTGNQSTNETLPQDADQYGEESDQTVEGDNDNPGQTPEPQPNPVPEPRVMIDIEPVNRSYDARQGQFAPATFRVENIGNQDINDLQLVPELQELYPDWSMQTAEIANLSVNESVTRDVFVQPSQDHPPGEYVVPVRAEDSSQNQLDLDYFTLNVLPSNFTSRVDIVEAPRTVSMGANSTQPLPVLIENTGERNLSNITAEFQNIEDCGSVRTSTLSSVDVNGTESLNISVQAGERTQTCNATLVVSSDEGAYAFSNVEFTTTPEEGLIPQEQRVPFLAIAWTFVLAAYAVMRKRYELDSSIVKIPFLMLLMGETLIILYMLVNYYGIISVSFLPF